MPTIIVNISPEGDVKVEAQGIAGIGCRAFTRAIEESLGKVTADHAKAEMFQKQTQANAQSQGSK